LSLRGAERRSNPLLIYSLLFSKFRQLVDIGCPKDIRCPKYWLIKRRDKS